MAQGPGRYDDYCTTVRVNTNAAAVILLVMGGDRGTGLSIQITNHSMTDAELATILRNVATTLDPPQ